MAKTNNIKTLASKENYDINAQYCETCGDELNWKGMSVSEKAQWMRTGMCPECYAKHMEEVRAKAAANKAKREAAKERAKNRPESAYSKVYKMITSLDINDELVDMFTDKEFSRTAFGLAYSLLLPVSEEDMNDKSAWEELTFNGGKSRYSKKNPIQIGDQLYVVTNNIYAKNVGLVKSALVKLGLLDEGEDVTTETAEA